MAWKVIMTNSGVDLLSGMLGGARLSITRAAIGSDVLSDEEIKELNDLNNKIPAYVQAVKLAGETKCETVQVRISNLGMTEPAVMHQVGLYAKIDDGTDVLLVVYQNDFGEEIPSYAEYPNLSLKFNAGLDISITDNIVVVVNHNAFAAIEDVYNSVEISSNPVPSAGVRTHYFIVKTIPVYNPSYPIPGFEDGMLQTDSGMVEGYIQGDEGVLPMAVLTE